MKICYNCFHELSDNARICQKCGMGADISNAAQYPHALPCGSVLAGKYLTGRVLGQGGFGITYVAQNHQTKELVAIKEYYPDSMAIRDASHSVTPYNMDRSSNFEYGKERFLEEAKTLSEFIGNPHIVRVISYFEENGTAYFVMEHVIGISLKKHLQKKGGRISWQEATRLLTPVMDALSAVHEKGIIHRDVTPENIVIMDDGNVRLIDFGSARYSIGERSQSLDVILKHGFAPYEQYIRRSRQGSFTDVYSLAATFYYTITGLTPPEAIERIDNDTLRLPSSLGINIPAGVEAALQKALAVRSDERIRTMGEFKKAMEEGAGGNKGMTLAHGSNTAEPGPHDPEKPVTNIPQFGQKNPEDVEARQNNRTAAIPSTERDTTAQNQAVQDKTKQDPADQNTADREKEIDLTEYARNTDGKSHGKGGTDYQKNLPKILFTAAVIVAALIIILIVKNAGSGKGTDSQIQADGPNKVSSEELDADSPGETQEEDDSLSPEMKDLLAKAKQGDMSAQYELGTMYYNGTGVEQNYEEALAWFTKAAELGNTDAQFDLGEIYHNGSGAEKDDSKAIKYYRQAADSGHASAQCRYGVMLQNGEGEEKDEEEAVEWLLKSAEQDDPEGQYYLGKNYVDGTGTEQNYEMAFEWLTKAAKEGLPEAQYEIAVLYENGDGTDQSFYDAHAWYTKAADQGYSDAMFSLGTLYFNGKGVNVDYEEAFKWFTKAADLGSAKAQNMMGNCNKAGFGTDQNFEAAFAWYSKAADQGLPEAQFNLAETYESGRGVDKDKKKAADWYKKAAEQGHAKSQVNFGCISENGDGVEQSDEDAFYWFEKAAEQDDVKGELNLAYMYLTGTGTEQNYEEALKWLEKIAEYRLWEESSIAIITIADMYDQGIGVEKDENESSSWREKNEGNPLSQSLLGEYDRTRLLTETSSYPDDPFFCPLCGVYFRPCSEMIPIEEADHAAHPEATGWHWTCHNCGGEFPGLTD